MKQIEAPKAKDRGEYLCPTCGEKMEFDRSTGIGCCRNVICQHFFSVPQNNSHISKSNAIYRPMIEEGQRQMWRCLMRAEIRSFGFNPKILKRMGVGFYPKGFWVNKNDEGKFGSLLFPMEDWEGNIVNVMAKDIGRDDKIDLPNAIRIAWHKPYGLFNAKGFFHDVVHVFMNPTDCLKAIHKGVPNVVSVFGEFDMPPINVTNTAFLYPIPGRPTNEVEEFLNKEGILVKKAGFVG